MELRKQKEKEFHDKLREGIIHQRWSPQLEKIIQSNPLWVNMKYYSIEQESRKFVLKRRWTMVVKMVNEEGYFFST